MNTKKTQEGFTLIELMIVIAIIGILAAIAIPQYQDYTIRSKVSEGLSLAAAAKTAVATTYQSNGTMPTTNAEAGLPKDLSISGKYVKKVDVGANGLITITYNALGGDATDGKALTITPDTTSKGSLQWICGKGSAAEGETNAGGTTIPQKYLPANCRGNVKSNP
jgi:type IV pilus assembly protein PilA